MQTYSKKVQSLGNSLGVVIPKVAAVNLDIEHGDELELELHADHLVIRKAKAKPPAPPPSYLPDLFGESST